MSLDTQMRNEWAEMDGERIRKLKADLAKARAALKKIADSECDSTHEAKNCPKEIASEALKINE